MKGFWPRSAVFLAFALASTTPTFAGSVTFTCDSSIGEDFQPGGSSTAVCNYLNTVIGPEYSNTFSNVNANIYIEATNSGLGGSTSGFYNLVTYSTYQTALKTLSTNGAAKATVPSSEPLIFNGDDVELTSALAEALNITEVDGGGSVEGTTAGGDMCTTYATTGSGCYNGIIQVVTPAGLAGEEAGQGFDYRSLGGTTNGSTSNYDFFGVVEHETDEILGTASCIDTTADDDTKLSNPASCASAVDLFRYNSPGIRTFDTTGANAYFSFDGGVTDYEGNTYDNQANGQDWADFSNSCTFVQDGVGCPNGATFDILSDGPGGTVGPEVAILNAVGYNLVAPEPGTLGMLGLGFTALIAFAHRRRRNRLAPATAQE